MKHFLKIVLQFGVCFFRKSSWLLCTARIIILKLEWQGDKQDFKKIKNFQLSNNVKGLERIPEIFYVGCHFTPLVMGVQYQCCDLTYFGII